MERKVQDSCGKSGTGETTQGRSRGESPPALRKASTWSANQLLLSNRNSNHPLSGMIPIKKFEQPK
ncbi:hypothetical protein FGG79_15610 [Bacillus sp. BHET2]|nr:hypothetical protein FGG79_15610 [Bacillus sp. BHET2]